MFHLYWGSESEKCNFSSSFRQEADWPKLKIWGRVIQNLAWEEQDQEPGVGERVAAKVGEKVAAKEGEKVTAKLGERVAAKVGEKAAWEVGNGLWVRAGKMEGWSESQHLWLAGELLRS